LGHQSPYQHSREVATNTFGAKVLPMSTSDNEAKEKIVDHLAGGMFWFLYQEDDAVDEDQKEDLLLDCQDLTWVLWDSFKPELISVEGENTFIVKITTDIAGVIPFIEGKLSKD